MTHSSTEASAPIFPSTWQGLWNWHQQTISYIDSRPSANLAGPSTSGLTSTPTAVLLIHGFGACKEHWRHTMPTLASERPSFAIDLVGFGASSKPCSWLPGEPEVQGALRYCIDLWADQVATFIDEVIGGPVQLVGNSIGGVVALTAALRSPEQVRQVILIDCAQRSLDVKRLAEQPPLRRLGRPLLQQLIRQRWLTRPLFRWLANPGVIRRVLQVAYPSGRGLDQELVDLLLTPARSVGADESFRGFVNLFDDRLAPDLLAALTTPVRMIWGEQDPWEPIAEAERWSRTFPSVQELCVLPGLGHCPHDEDPATVNPVLHRWLAQGDGVLG